jgi:hypothetical protein
MVALVVVVAAFHDEAVLDAHHLVLSGIIIGPG